MIRRGIRGDPHVAPSLGGSTKVELTRLTEWRIVLLRVIWLTQAESSTNVE